jgi:hypothetical protein
LDLGYSGRPFRAAQGIIAAEGAAFFAKPAAKELPRLLLPQFSTERSALVSHALRVLTGVVSEHGPETTALALALIRDLTLLSGRGNSIIARFALCQSLTAVRHCPSPKMVAELHRVRHPPPRPSACHNTA